MDLKVTEGGAGMPPEPNWMAMYSDPERADRAASYWADIVAEMKTAGTVAPVNGHSIKRLVIFRVEFDGAAMRVATNGRAKAGRGSKGQPKQVLSGEWTCMKQAAEVIQGIEAELGLSPRRRKMVGKVQRFQKKHTAATHYLKPVPESSL